MNKNSLDVKKETSMNVTNSTTLIEFQSECVGWDLYEAYLGTGDVIYSLTSAVFGTVLLTFSLSIAFMGHAFITYVLVVIGAFLGPFFSLTLVRDLAPTINCELLIAICVGSSIIASVVARALLKIGVFLIGFVAGGGLVLGIFVIFPGIDEAWPTSPKAVGKSLIPFWITFLGVSSACGGMALVKQKWMLIISTVFLGSMGSYLSVKTYGGEAWVGYIVASVVALLGVGIQFLILEKKLKTFFSGKKEQQSLQHQSSTTQIQEEGSAERSQGEESIVVSDEKSRKRSMGKKRKKFGGESSLQSTSSAASSSQPPPVVVGTRMTEMSSEMESVV